MITGSWTLDILLLLAGLDIAGVINLQGWGGKRKNLVGEDLP